MTLIYGIGQLLTLEGAKKKQGRLIKPEDLGIITDAALVVNGAGRKCRVEWVGAYADLPAKYKKAKKINAHGAMVMPGFVDSHTHLTFAGNRAREFEMRLAGRTYQEIALAGGGIVKTMKATREISESDLYKLSLKRVDSFLKQGVTTIEIKTGYGLDFASEEKCLKVTDKLKKTTPATIVSTFLAAHDIPPEYKGKKTEYVETIASKWLPKLKNHSDYIDMFLDEGYFDKADAEILFSQALKYKIPIKLHADELKLTGGTETACKFKALSADHLLQITQNEVKLLANSEVTATLLPTTAFFLKAPYAPARALLDGGARVALATDFNPGTSPTQDISLVAVLAALQMNMKTEEIIVGLTLNGAYALGLAEKKGALLKGYDADFIIIDSDSVAKVFYEFGQVQRDLKIFTNGCFYS